MIRKSYAALRNLVNSLPNLNPDPDPDPNPMLSAQVESGSESESEKTGSDPHHCFSPKKVVDFSKNCRKREIFAHVLRK